MRRRLSGLWMVTNRPPCDEEFDSATSRFEVSTCSGYVSENSGFCLFISPRRSQRWAGGESLATPRGVLTPPGAASSAPPNL
jgi:hypothetical protein